MLIAPPPSLPKQLPHLALRALIENAELFDKKVIKALITRIGVYPIGSWVEVVTSEIGRVWSLNENSPLRPTVQVLYDENHHKLTEPKILDLSNNQNIYIKAILTEAEINQLEK